MVEDRQAAASPHLSGQSPADLPIVAFPHDSKVCAVDNRCPHIGLPLEKDCIA